MKERKKNHKHNIENIPKNTELKILDLSMNLVIIAVMRYPKGHE